MQGILNDPALLPYIRRNEPTWKQHSQIHKKQNSEYLTRRERPVVRPRAESNRLLREDGQGSAPLKYHEQQKPLIRWQRPAIKEEAQEDVSIRRELNKLVKSFETHKAKEQVPLNTSKSRHKTEEGHKYQHQSRRHSNRAVVIKQKLKKTQLRTEGNEVQQPRLSTKERRSLMKEALNIHAIRQYKKRKRQINREPKLMFFLDGSQIKSRRPVKEFKYPEELSDQRILPNVTSIGGWGTQATPFQTQNNFM